MKMINGGVCAAQGFEAAGVAAGVKKNGKKDMAVVYSTVPAVGAGVFTTNLVKAFCVQRNQQLANAGHPIQVFVANSGCANACTGAEGKNNNQHEAEVLAGLLNVPQESVLTAATGVIGAQLPMEAILNGVKMLAEAKKAGVEAAQNAAEAIMTTDTVSKQVAVEFVMGGKTVHLGGMVKGSGMIHPNMATMLAFLTTDAAICQELLHKALLESVQKSFNMISVDGDTSTNDMAIIMANGLAGNAMVTEQDEDYAAFVQAIQLVTSTLAKEMVKDGEGASKFIEVKVNGALCDEDAVTLSKSVITSSLVKTAFFGEDANWGRVLAALGYSGASFDPDNVTITFTSNAGTILLMDHGTPIVFDEEKAAKILAEREVTVD
ncbi:MAG: bifunctional ornithine acetyltransferase/N-acetylglutamate synthase, partial [Firmicutes bacterium]|nr:bifunctional ornithine acetyltransferase/N-acetylglutamate synthase [Bacillota bacterium]